MAQFQYTAVNQGGKKLTGLIGAPNEEDARKQLNHFGISVLSIQQLAETSTQSPTKENLTSKELPTFEFEAYDKTGQKVLGTIPASSRYKAFKRLMDEYEFEVSYVVEIGATPEIRAKAKSEGLDILKQEYEAQLKAEGKLEKSDDEVNADFEKKRSALLERVDFILEKIKGILSSYGTEIKPENKKIIQDYIDKLLRIKSSTNLDYIEHTSEELLKKVQDQELFLHKEKMASQRANLKLQTAELMAELHNRPKDQTDVMEGLEVLQTKLQGSENKMLKGISQSLKPFVATEEEKELKERVKTVNRQVWTFRKIWITAPKDTKTAAKESMLKIVEERDRLKLELKNLKKKRHPKATGPKEKTIEEPLITEEINQFLAWLLGFYLIAYFLSHYIMAKVFPGGNPLPAEFNLLESTTLRNVLLSLFVWYILLSLRIEYLRYQKWANAVVIPLGILINLSLLLNF